VDKKLGPPPDPGEADFTYLLVQLGAHLAQEFAERLAPLGLEPRHAGTLFRLAATEGLSQQAIGDLIGLNPTRMVFLVDELEQLGLVERRKNPADRRSYSLYLTDKGRDKLREIRASTIKHQDELGASLTKTERVQLTSMLRRLAAEQGITEHSLPGMPARKWSASSRPERASNAGQAPPSVRR
jgi:DNA-binding MarR family transcriptional regulator